MSKHPKVATVVCPECHTENNAFAANCWICNHPFDSGDDLVSSELVSTGIRIKGPSWRLACIAVTLVVGAASLIGLGVAAEDGAWALLTYGVFVGPIAAALIYIVVRGTSTQDSRLALTAKVISWIIIVLVMSPLMLIAVLIGLLLICLSAFARG